jgi:autotransporter-associated beta strand protein
MYPKTDPYATKLQKRIDVLLLLFIVAIIALVLGTSARGGPLVTPTLSIAPQPFWSALAIFTSYPDARSTTVVPLQTGYGSAEEAIALAALAPETSDAHFAPIFPVENRRPIDESAAILDPGSRARIFSAAHNGSVTYWNQTSGTGSALTSERSGVPAFRTGVSLAGSDVRSGSPSAVESVLESGPRRAREDHPTEFTSSVSGSSSRANNPVGSSSSGTSNSLAPASAATTLVAEGAPATKSLTQAVTPTAIRVEPDASIGGTGWKGTTNSLWSNSGNWDSTGPGADERNLFFGQGWKNAGGGGSTTANNDISGYSGYRITFEDINGNGLTDDQSFTITGNSFTLFDFGSGNFPRIENDSFVLQTFTLTSGNTITLSGGSNNKAEINPVNGDLVFSAGTKIDLAGSTQLQIYGNNGKSVTFGGIISSSGNSGNNSVAINQNSTVIYKAANTYAGDTFVNAGKLQFDTGGSANNSTIRIGDITGSANAEVDLLGSNQTISSVINPRAGSSGTLTISSQNTSGTNTLSNHIGVDKNFTISQAGGGTLAVTQGRSTATGTTTGFDIKTFTVSFTGAGNFTIGATSPTGFGTIYDSSSGAGGTAIIMAGTGSLSLNDANSYRGKTEIDSGTLFVGANNALGSSNGTIGTTGNVVLLGNTSGGSNAKLLTTGAFTIANVVTLQSGNTGVMTLGGDSANASVYSGAIKFGTANGTAKGGTFVAAAGGSVDFQGSISENTSVPASSVIIGDSTHSGVVKFSNTSNGYGGTTTITNGATLEVVSLGTSGNSSIGNSARGTASNLVLSNGTLKYTGAGESTTRSFTVDSSGGALDASGTGSITYTGTMASSGTGNRTFTLTGSNTGANTLQSAIADPSSGTTSLVKSGTGNWTLTGASTFNGSVAVNAGTLTLARSSGIALAGSPAITVNNNGTLLMGANNQINVATNPPITLAGGKIDAGGFSQGNTSTQIGLGALTLTSSSIIDLSSTSVLHFANSSANSWTGTLSIYNWSGTATLGNGAEQILFGTNATSLTLSQLNQISFYSDSGTTFLGTAAFAPDLDGEIIPLAPVPEPSTWVAAALTLGLVLWTQKRRLNVFTAKMKHTC